jgi:glycosyltransferase involved in cell wall biosynthesis
MRILQVTNRIPFPLNDGGNIGVHYYTEGFLNAGVQLSLLAMNTTRHWVDISKLPPLYNRLHRFETVTVDNRIKPLDAFVNLFQTSSYNINRFVSKAFEHKLIDMLQEQPYDIIQLEGLFLVPYIATIRKYTTAKIAIRQHNIEFNIWERLTAQAQNPLKKWYLKLLTKRLKRFELAHIHDYDLVLPISNRDAQAYQALGCTKPIYLHPFGVDVQNIPFTPYHQGQAISLYHLGAMDWLPNQESVDWLLEHVMPQLAQEIPWLKLYLAGRNMPQKYFELQLPNVVVMGEVPDAQTFERDKSILVVPLLSGGGVRIKIFQAMAMGKMIITSSVGVEGIEAQHGLHIILADTPKQFIEAIHTAIKNPQTIAQMGVQARNLIETQYDRQQLIQALLQRYGQLIAD